MDNTAKAPKRKTPTVILPIELDPDYSPKANRKSSTRGYARRELNSHVSKQQRIERSERLKENFVKSENGPLYGKERSKVPAREGYYGSCIVMVNNGKITSYKN